MTLATWCERSASIKSASVTGSIGVAASSSQWRRLHAEWRVARLEGEECVVQLGDAPGLGALAADVDAFKDEEGTALAHESSGRDREQRGVRRRALSDRRALLRARRFGGLLRRGAFFVVVFVALAAFFVAFAGALAAFFVALRTRVEGSALRRSARSSLARSRVMVSGVSPMRSVAFVSPSVT